MSDLDPTDAWAPPELSVPVELTTEFHAEPFAPKPAIFFPPLADRIDEAMRERLSELYGSM